ncbi:unnamed protein product [Rotaria sp. Silwood1]|nr:unnamed protein product [Rotaria sp. Silwood1]
MPDLAHDYKSDDNIDNEEDLTTISTSNLSFRSINSSPTPSLSNSRIFSPIVLHASLPKDLPDLSLENLCVETRPDSPIIPHQNKPISLELSSSSSSSNDIVDDFEKPHSNRNTIVNHSLRVPMDDKNFNKEIQDRLNSYEVQHQIRASISTAPNDIILMIIGSIAAIGSGVCFPMMFFIYQKALNGFVSYSHMNSNNTYTNSSECLSGLTNTTETSQADNIKHIIKYYVLIGFVSIFLSWIAWSSWMIAAERQVRCIRFALFRNILRQEIGWFDVHNSGALSNRLIDDLDKIKDGMSDKVPDFITLVSRTLGSLVYSFIVGWKLSLVFLSISPLVILTFNLTVKMIVKYTVKEVQAFASASSIAQEVLQNIRTVTAFHGQKKEEERFANSLIESKKIGIKKGIYVGICQGLNTIFNFSSFAVTVWYGPYLVRTECSNYSPGTVFVVLVACMSATLYTSQFIPHIQNFAEATGSGTYVFDIIARKTKIDAFSDEGDQPKTITGDIEFKNIHFTYPARDEISVLNNLSLKIPSGKTVALVGPSGCGKSTIVQLIQRFYDPDDGRVLLDGKDIRTLNVAWLRSHIGIVSQEPALFYGTIEDNIRLGKPDATDDEVETAAKMANAHDFIMALPQKYKTTSGDKLSGGQKQRIAIARALISNPKILLLDEATSALDNTSERIVQDALDKAKHDRTTIVIAHRLSTIQNADLIIVLEYGQVVEKGNHNELMSRKGLYYQLVTTHNRQETEDDEDDEEDNNYMEKLLISQVLANRRVSKQSIASSGEFDKYDDDISETSDHLSKKKKFFHVPFLYKISKLNIPELHWILLGTIASLVLGATQPIFGLTLSKMFGAFAESDLNKQKYLVLISAIIHFCIGIGGGIAQFLTSVGFAKSGEELTMRMRKMTFSAMLRQEISYFDYESNSTGALITRLSKDASALKGLTGVRIGIIFQAISAVITALIISFLSSWKLTLVVSCFSPLIIFTNKFQGQKQRKTTELTDETSFIEQGGQYATQAIENIRTVVALHQENHFINFYENAFNQDFKQEMYRLHLSAISIAISQSIIYFLHCTCFGYGIKLIENGEIKYEQMYRTFAVMSLAMMTVGRSLAMVSDYSKAKTAALRIMKLHERQSKIDPNDESGIILKNVIGNIEFCGVHFRYPSRITLPILKKFSLKCLTNSTTALVGPSGGGKSTTIALLQRFYDPLEGKILLDGNDIKILNIRWLRSEIALPNKFFFYPKPIERIIEEADKNEFKANDSYSSSSLPLINSNIPVMPTGNQEAKEIKSAKIIAENIRKFVSLEILYYTNNDLKDEDFYYILEAIADRSLLKLFIIDNNITEVSAMRIAKLLTESPQVISLIRLDKNLMAAKGVKSIIQVLP